MAAKRQDGLAEALTRFRKTGEAVRRVARELARAEGLPEEELLGLRVLDEKLGEAVDLLQHDRRPGARKAAALKDSGEAMCRAADALVAQPSEEQIAQWLPGIHAAVDALLAELRLAT